MEVGDYRAHSYCMQVSIVGQKVVEREGINFGAIVNKVLFLKARSRICFRNEFLDCFYVRTKIISGII